MRIQKVKIPVVGLVAEAGEILEWHVSVGDQVAAGDELCSVEFEKTEFAVESPSSGRVKELLVEVGAEVEPGTQVIILETDD